jgi:hypothetical protein
VKLALRLLWEEAQSGAWLLREAERANDPGPQDDML